MFEPESFKRFRDHPDPAFYCAEGLTPVETWGLVYEAFRQTINRVAVAQASGSVDISVSALIGWHRSIFGSLFPEGAGRTRYKDGAGRWETVSFGIDVGTAETRKVRQARGAHPSRLTDQLGSAVGTALSKIEQIEAAEHVLLSEAVSVAGELYGKVLRIHPFVDGNLRAAYVMLQACLVRLDLPMVVLGDAEAHDEAVSFAIRVDGKQSYQPISLLLEHWIRSADTG